jgi:peptidoglycan glycosyltransferase
MRQRADWRHYQRDLRRRRRLGLLVRRVAVLTPLAVLLGFTFLAVWHLTLRAVSGPVASVQADTGQAALSKPELASRLGNRQLDAERPWLLTAGTGEQTVFARTTIDVELQNFLTKELERSGSLRGACAVIDPATGRVLALASHDPGRAENLCLVASPAASIFKMVTAAACVEERQMQAGSHVYYTGDPHGLGHSVLKTTPGRYCNDTTLERAFACSVNPVFGRLGVQDLGAQTLRRWGERMGFNRSIPFELKLTPSYLEVPDEEFEVAKVASGFNRVTTISPLHAALLAGAVVEGGRMVEPYVIEQAEDNLHRPLYRPQPAWVAQVFSEATAQELRCLMEATVTEGTCTHTLLRELGRSALDVVEVGGKTGSISGGDGDWGNGRIKYDWFVGYALEKAGGRRLALAVFQEHGEYLGRKSPQVAAQAIRKYFNLAEAPRYVAKAKAKAKPRKRRR